jgi:RNA polymerase sigma-70 factor (ECF subfamily)
VKAVNSDEQLMGAFQGGSQEAFTELFLRYRNPIYGFFRRRLDQPARAEELAQETFLAVVKAVRRYQPSARFRTYLYGIAMKLLLAERRTAGRETERVADDIPAHSSAPEDALWIRRAVEALDPEHREVLMLREFEQLSYEEIAALLEIPVNTVRSRLFRARTALKDLLVAK